MDNYRIPLSNDWIDAGTILKPGKPGSWDARLDGMISPATVIKKDDIYFLYYIGADGNRSTDGGPRHRALGVATSYDGLHFTKYSNNPIITFLPNNNEEEGIFSAGATLDNNNNVILYYAACDAGNSTSENVNCDGRLAVSENGIDFVDKGTVLSHKDSSIWGYGDELFPVGVFHANEQWYVYYIAKGSGIETGIFSLWGKLKQHLGIDNDTAYWDLGIAWGPDKDRLTRSKAILTEGSYIIGGGDPVELPSGMLAQFIVRDFINTTIEARILLDTNPPELSIPIKIYNFVEIKQATVFFDKDTNKWFLYYLNSPKDAINLKTR